MNIVRLLQDIPVTRSITNTYGFKKPAWGCKDRV